MKDLNQFSATRRSLPFGQVAQDHPSEFFERHFSELFVEIHTLVSNAFCPDSNETKIPVFSPWLQKHRSEFFKYVQLIARPDPSTRQWGRLLRSNIERTCLLQAIIMKILDAHVFSNLLFGADLEHQKILESTDVLLVGAEGFRRSSLRAHTNRVYLETKRGEPPLFWSEVDKLCVQVLTLLIPVHEWTSDIEGWKSRPPSINDLYQWLHDIISYASWLSVCIQLSPAIMTYDWAAPGDRYHIDQINFAHEVYEYSEELARTYRQTRNLAPLEMSDTTARVKISMAPKIVRYRAGVGVFGSKPGMEAYTIMQPHVVYYEGSTIAQVDAKSYVSLPEYIYRLRNQTSVPRGTALFIMLLVALLLYVKFLPAGQRI